MKKIYLIGIVLLLLMSISVTSLDVKTYDAVSSSFLNTFTATVTDGVFTESYSTSGGTINTNFNSTPFVSRGLVSAWNLDKNNVTQVKSVDYVSCDETDTVELCDGDEDSQDPSVGYQYYNFSNTNYEYIDKIVYGHKTFRPIEYSDVPSACNADKIQMRFYQPTGVVSCYTGSTWSTIYTDVDLFNLRQAYIKYFYTPILDDLVGNNDGTLYGKTLNDGTITGATYSNIEGTIAGATWNGDILEFDGVGDIVDTTYYNDFRNGGTVSFWVTNYGTGGYCRWIDGFGTGSHSGVSVQRSNDDLRFYTSSGAYQYQSQIFETDGERQHLILTTDGTRSRIYKNNVQVSYGDKLVDYADDGITIGSADGVNGNCIGIIEDVTFINAEVTADERLQLMNGATPNDLGYIHQVQFPMNEGTGTTIYNYEDKFGDYLDFDGDNDYVNTASDIGIDINNGATIMFYIKPDVTGTKILMSDYDGTNGFFIRRYSDYLRVNLFTAGSDIFQWLTGSTKINVGEQNHITLVSNTTHFLTYKEGVYVQSTALPVGYVDGGILGIASQYEDFDGSIDEVKIWNEALTQSEIQEEMTSVGVANPEGIVAYYNFDEGSGTTTYDKNYVSTGLNENVTSYNFDRVDDYIKVTDDNIIGYNEPFYFNVWIKTDNSIATQTIYTQNDNDGARVVNHLSILNNDYLQYDNYNPSGGALNSNSTIVLNEWTSVAINYVSEDLLEFYINGVLDNYGNPDNQDSYADIDSTLLGARYYSGGANQQFGGAMALATLYNRSLNATEILDKYNREYADKRYPFQQDNINISITNAVGEELRPYFDNETNDIDVISNINMSVNPYTKINTTDNYTDDKIDNFNLTYNSVDYSSDVNGNIFLPLTTATIMDVIKDGYYTITKTFSPYSENEESLVYYTRIYANSAYTNNSISNFTILYDNVEYNTTTNYVSVPLYNESQFIEIYNANNGTENFTRGTQTIVGSPYLQNYTFYLYDKPNILEIDFFNSKSGARILNNTISIEISSDSYYALGSTSNSSFYIDGLTADDYIIKYSSVGYETKFYYLTISNSSYTNLNLYMNNETTSEITFTIYDELGNPVEDGVLKILSQVNGTSEYLTTTMGKTNPEGQLVLNLYLNTVLYKIIVEVDGEIVKITEANPLTSTDIELVVDLGGEYVEDIKYVFDISSKISYSLGNNSFNVTYLYNDAHNEIAQGCLYVYQIQITEEVLVNSSCTAASTGVIVLNVPKTTGVYVSRGYITYNSKDYKVYEKSINLDVIRSLKGNEALFLGGLLILVMAIGGALIHISLGFVAVGIGALALFFLGIITISVATPIMVVAVILAIIAGIRK